MGPFLPANLVYEVDQFRYWSEPLGGNADGIFLLQKSVSASVMRGPSVAGATAMTLLCSNHSWYSDDGEITKIPWGASVLYAELNVMEFDSI